MGCPSEDKDRWTQSRQRNGRGLYDGSVPLTTICLAEGRGKGSLSVGSMAWKQHQALFHSSEPLLRSGHPPLTKPPTSRGLIFTLIFHPSWRQIMIQAKTPTLLSISLSLPQKVRLHRDGTDCSLCPLRSSRGTDGFCSEWGPSQL